MTAAPSSQQQWLEHFARIENEALPTALATIFAAFPETEILRSKTVTSTVVDTSLGHEYRPTT